MEPFLTHTLSSIVLASTEVAEEEGGSFLVTPGVGLMIWTLLVFFFTLWVLKKFAFPAITEAIDKRAKVIRESIESAEQQKEESDRLLAEIAAEMRRGQERKQIGPHGIEGDVAQVQQTGVTHHDIQAHCQQNIQQRSVCNTHPSIAKRLQDER
mgnify:CR=1 FL=1